MEEFLKDIASHQTAPFLFLGSGFSRRYLETPGWQDLLGECASWMGKNLNQYTTRVTQYDPEDNMYLPHVAKFIAQDFVDTWWKEDRYEAQRNQYQTQMIDYRGPLKVSIAQYLSSFGRAVTAEIQEELQALEDLKETNAIEGIITTNWDTLAEEIFEYKSYIGQQQLLFSNLLNVGEILKIHGCVTEPNSLVLDEKDYLDFNKRNPYLAAKLTTIFIEHPIVFIGYSLRDKNIREILDALLYGVGANNIDRFGKGIYFIEYDRKKQGYQYSRMPVDLPSGRLEITNIRTDDYKSIYKILGTNQRKFPAKLVRQMKEHLYELLLTDDPKKQIMVTELKDDQDVKNIQFVYGAGVIEKMSEIGYGLYDNDQLFLEIMDLGTEELNYQSILQRTLVAGGKQFVPVHKFISESGLNENEIPKNVLKRKIRGHSQVISQRVGHKAIQDKINSVNAQYSSLQQLLAVRNMSNEKKLEAAVYLLPEKVDSELLKKCIVDYIGRNGSEMTTPLRKLIKYYDWLVYGRSSVAKTKGRK